MDKLNRDINEAINKELCSYKNYNDHTGDYDDYYDYETENEIITENILKSFSEEEINVINYVKARLKAIRKYSCDYFKEMAFNKLIVAMYKKYNAYEVDDKLVDDILDYLENDCPMYEEDEQQKRR